MNAEFGYVFVISVIVSLAIVFTLQAVMYFYGDAIDEWIKHNLIANGHEDENGFHYDDDDYGFHYDDKEKP